MNKVFYGEYTLAHWVELMLTQNIVLPEYQRYFVWDESEVKGLMDSIKDNLYVPAITIGAFKNDTKVSNLIIDGQQRLTTLFILLNVLGCKTTKSLSFACREKSNYTLHNIEQILSEKKDLFDYEKIQSNIENGINIIGVRHLLVSFSFLILTECRQLDKIDFSHDCIKF